MPEPDKSAMPQVHDLYDPLCRTAALAAMGILLPPRRAFGVSIPAGSGAMRIDAIGVIIADPS